jgi:RNA polymerase sigma-70 factor (ECF subfamily)
MAPSDRELMLRLQRGDTTALDPLRARHEATLALHLRRYLDAEEVPDLLQEIWWRAAVKAEQWEGRGEPLPWLLRMATNLALNYLRDVRGKRDHAVSVDLWTDAEEEPAPLTPAALTSPSAQQQADAYEALERLATLLAALPEEKRTVLSLARLGGRPLAQIANELGLPLGTVKSRLSAATQWLRERWEEEEE